MPLSLTNILSLVQNVYDCWVGKIETQTKREKDNRWLSDQTEADYSSICIDHSDDNLSWPFIDPYANALKPTIDLFAMHVVCILIC